MTLSYSKTFTLGACILLASPILQAKIDNSLPQSPWQKNTVLTKSKISPIYNQQWVKSDTKKVCPILALPNNSAAQQRNSTARSAYFSGGWGVAYDVARTRNAPILRSAYGVANAGTSSESRLFAWDNKNHYADGSYMTYGHEGNNPNGKWLAYVLLDNGCFYNVWSEYSQQHLLRLINDLHYVK